MNIINEAANLINRSIRIAVATHQAPDPDAIGSLLAIGLGLKFLNKIVVLICDDPVPDKLRFLPGSSEVRAEIPSDFEPDLLIGVDASDKERLGSAFKNLLDGSVPVLNIDHHITNLNFGTVNVVVPESAASCEALLPLFHALDIPLTVEMSTCLMAGIVGDTRSFSTSSVTSNTLAAAARLVGAGADIATIAEFVFNRRSIDVLRLWGIGLSDLHQDEDVLWTVIPFDARTALGIGDVHDSGLGNILLSAAEANITVVFIEQPTGIIEVSLRARPGYDVASTALSLGGGGHALAAGCKVKGTLHDVTSSVVRDLKLRRPSREAASAR